MQQNPRAEAESRIPVRAISTNSSGGNASTGLYLVGKRSVRGAAAARSALLKVSRRGGAVERGAHQCQGFEGRQQHWLPQQHSPWSRQWLPARSRCRLRLASRYARWVSPTAAPGQAAGVRTPTATSRAVRPGCEPIAPGSRISTHRGKERATGRCGPVSARGESAEPSWSIAESSAGDCRQERSSGHPGYPSERPLLPSGQLLAGEAS